jgi:photosystem II stability/assembly factor-like uncharacterized protein
MKLKATYISFLLVALLVALGGQTSVSGAQTSSAWSKLGSMPAGAWDIASEDATSSTLYSIGNEGMARSTDGGASWVLCNREARSMRVVSVLPGQNTRAALFVTTPNGLRRSDDSCRTWNDVPTQDVLPSGGHIRWITPYPNNLTVLYAGMDGLGGLYRSIDGGSTWKAASQGLPPGGWITSLTADPQTPAVIFVGLRYPARTHSSSYLYRSSDGGLTWRSSAAGLHILPNNGSYVNGFAWSGDTLFASTLHDGLYASTDRGVTWKVTTMPRRPGDSNTPSLPMNIASLAAGSEGQLVLGTEAGAFSSLDGGRSWQSFGPDGTLNREVMVALDPNSGRVLLGAPDAIWSYRLPGGQVRLPTATASPPLTASPTPPPPPQLPTSTHAPPTATATKTPIPPSPTPVPVQGYKPSDPAQPGDPEIFTYFPDTKHNLGHGFRDFWQANGSISQFGFPISEEFVENGVPVQYFERARFEYRDGKVTLGRLGAELTEGTFFRTVPFFPSSDTDVYFGATGHSVEGPFLTFWRDNGRETLLGLPLSQSFKDDGSEYQWFERARIEWHPYLPEDNRIVLGNLGTLALQRKGWLP